MRFLNDAAQGLQGAETSRAQIRAEYNDRPRGRARPGSHARLPQDVRFRRRLMSFEVEIARNTGTTGSPDLLNRP